MSEMWIPGDKFRAGMVKGGNEMIATHLVKVSYYVSEGISDDGVRLAEKAKWKQLLGDALENVEVENLK